MSWDRLNFEQRTRIRLYLENHIHQNIPGFEIREKKQSLWMKFLSKLLFFVPDFMNRFVTTFYPVVYIPSRHRWESDNLSSIITMAHEYVHLSDRKRLSLFFNFLYLTPQVFSLLALLFPYSNWFLLFLVCLLPLPSFGRAWAEFRGYRMSMAVYYWLVGKHYDVEYLIHQFVSRNYYWMFPFRASIKKQFKKELESIQQDKLAPELREIKNVLTLAQFSMYNKTL